MAEKKGSNNLFKRLTRLFRSGPVIKRKIKTVDTTVGLPSKQNSSAINLFQRSLGPTYSHITANAYNMQERMSRYQDFNEMEYTAEINSAMDIYSDETVAQDEKGRTLHIYSNNPKIKETIEDLFYNVLNVEFNLRPWTRNLVKYGDFFLYNDVSPTHGVVNVIPIPVNEIEREEGYDKDDPAAVRFRWVSLGNKVLENWEITHMRLLGNDMFLPYGSSILEGARRIWRQLVLIEDAMLVYRIVRSPERRVFYIDVGNTPQDEVPNILEQAKTTLRSQQVIDKNTGRVDLRYNPLSVDEDYFIPVRGSESGTRIDTLQGGQNTAAVEDVQYIQRKLFAALKVPKAYLGYDEMLSSKATLAQEDIRFSRTINMIQRTIISELNKVAIIHLFANGFEDDDLLNFTLRLSNPSTVAQQQKLELYRTKFEIAGTLPENLLSRDWLRRNVLGLTEEEIIQVERELIQDASTGQALENAAAGGGGGGGGSGGGGAGPDLGGEEGDLGGEPGAEPGGEETPPEEPPPENAGEQEEEDKELLTAGDEPHDPIKLSMRDESAPIKAQNRLERTLYNRGRRRTHGASKTHMPDFNKMTGNNSREMKDPYDMEYLKSTATNPLADTSESTIKISLSGHHEREGFSPAMTNEIYEMLQSMIRSFRPQTAPTAPVVGPVITPLLTESEQIEDLEVIIDGDVDE